VRCSPSSFSLSFFTMTSVRAPLDFYVLPQPVTTANQVQTNEKEKKKREKEKKFFIPELRDSPSEKSV
jgi:hypothetical protein